jgi:putative ABC transport system permease protein
MLRQDLRFALRLLWKQPAFTIMAVAALGLGIGANTAIFSVVNAVVLRPLPYEAPERIVDVIELAGRSRSSVSPMNFIDWQAQATSFDGLALYDTMDVTLTHSGESEPLIGVRTSASLFQVLRTAAAMGRTFTAAEEPIGAPLVAVISHRLWTRRFGADWAVVGRGARFDGETYTIVGVMPVGFSFPDEADVWVPIGLTTRETSPGARGAHYLSSIARLRDGVSQQAAQTEMDAIAARLRSAYPGTNRDAGVLLQPTLESLVENIRPALLTLLGAVGCVLLIACANVSNLLLARASARRVEMAVRTAIGASRAALVRQLLLESVLLALVAGAAGVAIASWGVRVLMRLLPQDLPRADTIAVDSTVLGFTLLLSLGTGILFGLMPALQTAAKVPATALGDARRDGGGSARRGRLRALLVVAEVALAMVLLVGAGLTLRSLDQLTRVDPGFSPENVLSVTINLPAGRYAPQAARAEFFRRLSSAIAAQPGVNSVSAAMIPPLTRSGFGGTFEIVGRPAPASPIDAPAAQLRTVLPGYFRTLNIPIVRGRDFSDDDRDEAPGVALISEAAARRFWPGEDPIGKRLRPQVSGSGKPQPVREIVGIVADVKLARLEGRPVPVLYVPHAQHAVSSMVVLVRTPVDPIGTAAMVQGQMRAIDSEVVVSLVTTMDRQVRAATAQPRFAAVLLGLFAVLALMLAAIGLYGVLAYVVSQRTHEIGLRMALGAHAGDVVRLVVRQGMLPVIVGLVLGLAGAVGLTRVLDLQLFTVQPIDARTFTAVSVLLMLVALGACILPARRAAGVDPISALRCE